MSTQTGPTFIPVSRDNPVVDLHISGKNLLLSGLFQGWQSRLVLGPDLDDVGLSLFVDATSVRPANDTAPRQTLFSFHSQSVQNVGKGLYRVVGDFTGAQPTRELTLDVETPMGHTALISLSFSANRKDFGEHWQSVVENATLFGQTPTDGPQREAAGWLTTPTVGAA